MAFRGVLHHHKTLHLAMLLKLPPCFAVGILESMWHATGSQTPNGGIGRMSNQAIAAVILYPHDADELVNSLVAAGFLDEDRTHRLIVHNWHKRADDHVHAHLYRSVERFANGALPKPKKVDSKQRPMLEAAWHDLLAGKPKLLNFALPEAELPEPQPQDDTRQPLAANGCLPEPVPVPVPVPAPVPEPESSALSPSALAALTEASQHVLLHCGVSGTSAVGLQVSILGAIDVECRRVERPPEEYAGEVARVMIANHAEYIRAGPTLAFRWGEKKFFEEGHWRNFEGWPVDRDRERQAMQANMGRYN